MAEPPESRITQLLVAWSEGDSGALSDLTPLIYEQLRGLAARHLRREPAAQTLQTTGLVHEAFLRLVDQRSPRWQNRSHFFAIASSLMRRVLVDQARARLAQKRGGGRVNLQLDAANTTLDGLGEHLMFEAHNDAREEEGRESLLGIDAALTRLGARDPRQAQIVELRFFGGLTVEETAQVLDISNATVKRDWMMAKAWLARELAGGQS
jgi:RNA polymerase sigma factor (TIGR02999 family)